MKFVQYFILAAFFLLFGIVYSVEVPKFKAWVLKKIESVSRERLDVEVSAKNIDFQLYPIGIQLQDIRLKPKGPIAAILAPAEVDKLSVGMSFASLVSGRFEIGNITLVHPVASLFFRSSRQQSVIERPQNQSPIFSRLSRLPIRNVVIQDAQIRARVEPADLLIQAQSLGFQFERHYRWIMSEIFAPDLQFKRISLRGNTVPLGFATRVRIDEQSVEVSALKAVHRSSSVILRAFSQADFEHLGLQSITGRSMGHINFSEVAELLKTIAPQITIPKVDGMLSFNVFARPQRGREPAFVGDISGEHLQVAQFHIGDVSTRFKFLGRTLSSEDIKFNSSAGRFSVKDLFVKLGDETKVSGRVNIEEIELRQLLLNLGVDDTPLHLDVSAHIPCEGFVTPQVKIVCGGEARGSNLRVHTRPENKTIVALKDFNVMATLNIDKNKISFPKGLIAIGKSTGEASGEVDFKKGFTFKYHTGDFDFKDIQSLADLKYEGSAALDGTTTGDSDAATFEMTANSKNFWFEDYWFGAFSSNVKYEKGNLHFDNIQGNVRNSSYSGNTIVNLHSPVSLTTHCDLSRFELDDLISVFSRKVQLPFEAHGTGSGIVDASGPASLPELTYKVRSSVGQGSVAGETFKGLQFNVRGVNGHAYVDDVHMIKGDGRFDLLGDVTPSGMMNLKVHGRGLHLSDFDNARALASGLEGHFWLDMGLHEFILKPHVDLDASLSDSTVNLDPLGDSNLHLSIDSKGMKLKSQFFNNRIRWNLDYPFADSGPFNLYFVSDNWDFSKFLSAIIGANARREFSTNLTSEVRLSNPRGTFLDSRGQISVSQLFIRHGASQMTNPKPISIKFDDGLIRVESLSLVGDNTQLTVTGERNRKENLNFNINGRVDLSLLGFLMPFFRDVNGQVAISTQVGGTTFHPDLLGSAYVKKGFFRLETFPHPFENIEADILFSQSRILVNRLQGGLASGSLSASGSVALNGFRDIATEVVGDVRQMRLSVPQGLRTHGDLHFSITGNWFPYLLKGTYNIESGTFTKTFGDNPDDNVIKRSVLLPKLILQKDFSTIELDIATHFKKGVQVRNNLMELEAKGDLEVMGNPDFPILKGDIEASPGGKFFFRDNAFIISTATLKFDNPKEINPQVYALGSTRVRDWDVSLLVQGTQKNTKFVLSSSPPLAEPNIISLLAMGVTDETEQKGSDQATYNAGGLLLSQNPLQQEIKKQFGVNVRLSQKVDETKNGGVLPRVIAEKQWTPRISTSVSQTVGDRVTRDVDVEYKLTKHFSVLGSYEGRDFNDFAPPNASQTSTNLSTDIFGLDLQYQVEFK